MDSSSLVVPEVTKTCKFILLNGPPRSGKDSAAAALCDTYSTMVHEKFSAPLKYGFAGMMNVGCREFVVDDYEARKEEVVPELGVSFRQWQIDFSEKFMKPLYGNDVFARLLFSRMKNYEQQSLIVISDCGFQIEVDTLLEHVPIEQTLLIRCVRDGYDFKGDSRGYLVSRGPSVVCANNGTLDEWYDLIVKSVGDFLQ